MQLTPVTLLQGKVLPKQAAIHPQLKQSGRQHLRQAVRHVPIFPGSASSQTGSMATSNTPTREGPSQAGNNSPSNQAGRQVTRSGRQVTWHSTRHRALQASQGNNTASQTDSASSWEGNPLLTPPIDFPKGPPGRP